MSETRPENEPASATLCKACGLCCTGHLFTWAWLKSDEIKSARHLGLTVLRPKVPKGPGFSLPCLHWQGQCTIYTHLNKPNVCDAFECKLLKEFKAGHTPLAEALTIVQKAKEMIQELDAMLPSRLGTSFRRRLFEYVMQLEENKLQTKVGSAFRLKAGILLILFERRFGVTDLFNKPNGSN